MTGGATFDATGAYRYRLWREWDAELPAVAFVMLNPSTADAERDDPTVRRCIGFARSWGFGHLEVVNLFGFRASTPPGLFAAPDPEGPDNRRHLGEVCAGTNLVIAAWGNHGARALRPALARDLSFSCLGLTKLGQPRHPLFVRSSVEPQSYP